MSAGSFLIGKYEANDASVRPIRIQPETIAGAWNPEGSGASAGFYVRVSGSPNGYGLKARTVTLKQNVGNAVGGYQPTRPITLPVLTLAAWTALSPGQTVAYNGSDWKVAGKKPESGK